MRTEGGAPTSEPQNEQQPPEGGQQQPEGPPEWLGPITERMNELHQQTASMAEQIAGLYQQPESEPEGEEEFELYDAETGELTPEAAERIIDQRVEQMLNDRLSARDAADALEMRDAAFDDLRDRIEDLQDDAYATQLVREVAAQLEAEGLSNVIETPVFVDLIESYFKASKYDEGVRAAEEEEEPQREVVLEGAGGAHQRTPKGNEIDWAERVEKAAQSLNKTI